MKKASIVIINYNDKIRVTRAIQSAINQTYENKEIIIVDDGSDQATRDLYKNESYMNLRPNPMMFSQLERDDKTKRTPSRARNEGIKMATGDYICFLDSDNYYDINFLSSMMKYDNDVMYCDWAIIGLQEYNIDLDEKWKINLDLLNNYLNLDHLDHQCLLIKRDTLDKAGHYDERLPRSQDCDLIVRLMQTSDDWKHIPSRLFYFEKHEENQTKSLASMYGKTLWCLKNELSTEWLVYKMQHTPVFLWPVFKAIQDFISLDIWREEFEKNKYRDFLETFDKELMGQLIEVKEKETK